MNKIARVAVTSGFLTLLVHEAHATEVVNAAHAAGSPEAFDRMRGDRADDAPWNSYRVDNGMALIPVMGALIPRGTFPGLLYGVTSYEGLRNELKRAVDDPTVTSIALMIDSPGGYVSGVDATAAAIKTAGESKPVTAYVQGMACSAAYWLASACKEIVASPLAELGSIGVVQAHVDMSKMLDDFGIKVTLLHAGAHKVDGNPYEPLSDRVKSEMTQRLEDLRMAFAEGVASGRPSLTVAAVLATEADTYFGDEVVKRGLADRIGLLDDDIPTQGSLDLTAPLQGLMLENAMTDKTFTQAEVDTALATAVATARAEAHTAGVAEGKVGGATAERARIKGIMGGEHAAGREDLAAYFAYDTDTPAEAASTALSRAAKAGAVAQTLAQEQAADLRPNVGADGGKPFDQLKGAERGAAVAALLGVAKKSAA